MLPDPGERLVLNIGTSVVAIPNDDPRRVGLSIGPTGTLAVAADDVAVVLQMSVEDWLVLAEAAAAVACALAAQRDPELARAATLAMAEAAGHA